MYLINKSENSITKLEEKTFSELGIKERENLQEWIADNPDSLGEPLLIIQKEFNGFNETNERLDLLALDKQGNLVIIENKLDDSGRDVTWQSLKYASYSSSLTKDDIKHIFQEYLIKERKVDKAEDILSEFFEDRDYEEIQLNQGSTQRIIMIARKYRKEVTSTVLWLMNYNIRIQCFKATPFALSEQLFLNLEQILPIKDTEDFAISMANKVKDEINTQENLKNRHYLRREFWSRCIDKCNTQNSLFGNISPSTSNWIGIGIGMSGVNLNLVATKKYCRAEIYFNRGDKVENKKLYDFVYNKKGEIEASFDGHIIWQRMDDKVSSRIKSELTGVDIFEKDDWEEMTDYLVSVSEKMYNAFKKPIKELNEYAKSL